MLRPAFAAQSGVGTEGRRKEDSRTEGSKRKGGRGKEKTLKHPSEVTTRSRARCRTVLSPRVAWKPACSWHDSSQDVIRGAK